MITSQLKSNLDKNTDKLTPVLRHSICKKVGMRQKTKKTYFTKFVVDEKVDKCGFTNTNITENIAVQPELAQTEPTDTHSLTF